MSDRQYITVGVVREVKVLENRVGLTPATAMNFIQHGHKVLVQSSAGEGSGFMDGQYEEVGCSILGSAEEVYAQSDMIIKVKEPLASEYPLIKPNQLLYTYFHFAANEELTKALVKSQSVCVAYETLELANHSLPLLVPMSEIAGRMAIQQGAKYLESPQGGRGVLLGGVPGVKRGKVVVIGGGVVGANAANLAAGLGADVTVLDSSFERLRHLDTIMPKNVTTIYSTPHNLRELLKDADLVIGAVLVAGAKAPKLVTRDMLKLMKKGSVIVDVAVDQGGCVETTRATTHDKPTYVVDGVVHYCVANMPGAVPATSTEALTNATLCYGLAIADYGYLEACRRRPEIKSALNIVKGQVTNKPVAEAFDLPFTHVESLFVGTEHAY